MMHGLMRLGAFYNRKELNFSSLDQFLSQVFAGLLALTAAALWPRLLTLGIVTYLVLAILFSYVPIRAKFRQISAHRTKPFTIREQKLSQLAVASLFLALASGFPAIRTLNFHFIVALGLGFALRPVYLLYLKDKSPVIRLAGLALLVGYALASLTLFQWTAP